MISTTISMIRGWMLIPLVMLILLTEFMVKKGLNCKKNSLKAQLAKDN